MNEIDRKLADVILSAVKAATAPLLERIAALEARAPVSGPPGPQGERGADGPVGPIGPAGKRGADGVMGPVGPIGGKGLDGEHGKDGRDGLDGKDGAPGRDGQPGVPGRDGERGQKGLDGQNGKDGRDGTLESLAVAFDGERTVTFCRADGTPIPGGSITLPVPIDCGVYREEQVYRRADAVTFGGSLWIAQREIETGEKPGDASGAWRLAVKHGRDGREGKPGKDGGPGPKGEKGDPGRDYR